MNDNKNFSFEFSAPKTTAGVDQLKRAHGRLSKLAPDFFSVTYGAGGSTKEGTVQTVLDLNDSGSEVAPHLSFGGSAPEKIVDLLNMYKENGINRIVALRGDVPSGMGSLGVLRYANELVELIRSSTGDHFHIEVAAYPEIHPESPNVESELEYFKIKVDAGADSAITQYFYNADAYFHFVDRCSTHGINIPIVPGIMPIVNYTNLARFSDNCGAEIPQWIRKQMESYHNDKKSVQQFGEEVVTRLCEKLLEGGAPGLHFYTLNQALPSIRIWKNLNLDAK